MSESYAHLKGKRVVLGVSGSIAAYKAADICSQLVKWEVDVHVVMTSEATKIIAPITLQTMSRNSVSTDMWEVEEKWEPGHIDLADSAELLLIAPATAHTLAKFAHGLAPDLLSNIYLATLAPVMIAPAMNGKMLDHPVTQQNIATLKQRGHSFIEPDIGMLACGYEGKGKLASVEIICQAVSEHFKS